MDRELRRRRAALIDMLYGELSQVIADVDHEPNELHRKNCPVDDELAEVIMVGVIPLELRVRAKLKDGVAMNRLMLRFSYLPSQRDSCLSYYRTATEPKTGFDLRKLSQRLLDEAHAGASSYAEAAVYHAHREAANNFNAQRNAERYHFELSACDYTPKGSYGPFEVRVRGVCGHLAERIFDLLAESYERNDCGARGDTSQDKHLIN